MTKRCDNKSVGMLVFKDSELLLIERARLPFGFAPPAGHVDTFASFEDTAEQELQEEVGLNTTDLKLIWEGRKENKCRREGGSWHYWKIYEVQASGDVTGSLEETKQTGWYSRGELEKLLERTHGYTSGSVTEEEWERNPGIELVWVELLRELKKV